MGKLQKAVLDIKQSRRMEGRAEGLVEGRKESLFEFLAELGTIPENIRMKIKQEDDVNQLMAWLKLAAKVDTIEQFMENM